MPICHDGYMGTAPDLSGSISKNRFRTELFWGIDRLLTCLDSGIDSFAVVFDYRCDIELHLDDRYEFYQVKTGGKGKFGVTWATRLPKRGISIIARLYELDDAAQDCPIKLVIVGNRPFVKKGGSFDSPGEVLFATLEPEDKQKIEQAVTRDNKGVTPDLNKASYLLVAMNLDKPQDSVRGHLLSTYHDVMGCEPKKPMALCEALEGLVSDRACNEKQQPDYESVISNKGISHEEVRKLFSIYEDREETPQGLVSEWIKDQPPLMQNSLRIALQEYATAAMESQTESILKTANALIKEADPSLSANQLAESVSPQLISNVGPEISIELAKIYVLIAAYTIALEG